MDVQTEKLRLIEWLAGLDDENLIKELITLKKKTEVDWWGELSSDEKSEIGEGLAQAVKGEVLSHENVMSKYQKWL